MAFLRSIATASFLPSAAGLAFVALSSSSSHRSKLQFPVLPFSSLSSKPRPHHLFSSPLTRTFAPPPQSAIHMDSSPLTDQKNEVLPQLLTEFMVDMKCDGCVSAVKNKLQALSGIERVDVDLSSQVVRVLGSLPVKTMVDALEQTGRTARLIGQGSPEDFLISAAVAEFKGPVIFGVVRLAQVSMELARIESSFSGLSPGKHGWSINEFGDLTRGAVSTGKVFNPKDEAASEEPLGDLGTLDVHESGEAFFTGSKKSLKVADLIGRSVVVYETEDKSDQGVAAAVIARSAGVGENYKKLCTCDGVTIWESGKNDFAARKA